MVVRNDDEALRKMKSLILFIIKSFMFVIQPEITMPVPLLVLQRKRNFLFHSISIVPTIRWSAQYISRITFFVWHKSDSISIAFRYQIYHWCSKGEKINAIREINRFSEFDSYFICTFQWNPYESLALRKTKQLLNTDIKLEFAPVSLTLEVVIGYVHMESLTSTVCKAMRGQYCFVIRFVLFA